MVDMWYLTCTKKLTGLCNGRLTSSLHNIIEVAKGGCLITLDHFNRSIRTVCHFAKLTVKTVHFGSADPFFPGLCRVYRAGE
jgi:hypothetical protein